MLSLALVPCEATHFRGGTISCEPVIDSTTTGGLTSTGAYKVGVYFITDWFLDQTFTAGIQLTLS